MFTHTGPRRGDVFSESTFAKQIAMIIRLFLTHLLQLLFQQRILILGLTTDKRIQHLVFIQELQQTVKLKCLT